MKRPISAGKCSRAPAVAPVVPVPPASAVPTFPHSTVSMSAVVLFLQARYVDETAVRMQLLKQQADGSSIYVHKAKDENMSDRHAIAEEKQSKGSSDDTSNEERSDIIDSLTSVLDIAGEIPARNLSTRQSRKAVEYYYNIARLRNAKATINQQSALTRVLLQALSNVNTQSLMHLKQSQSDIEDSIARLKDALSSKEEVYKALRQSIQSNLTLTKLLSNLDSSAFAKTDTWSRILNRTWKHHNRS